MSRSHIYLLASASFTFFHAGCGTEMPSPVASVCGHRRYHAGEATSPMPRARPYACSIFCVLVASLQCFEVLHDASTRRAERDRFCAHEQATQQKRGHKVNARCGFELFLGDRVLWLQESEHSGADMKRTNYVLCRRLSWVVCSGWRQTTQHKYPNRNGDRSCAMKVINLHPTHMLDV